MRYSTLERIMRIDSTLKYIYKEHYFRNSEIVLFLGRKKKLKFQEKVIEVIKFNNKNSLIHFNS